MTDTPPYVDDVSVRGQRRRPGGVFPSLGGTPGGSSGGEDAGPIPIQVGEDDANPPDLVTPCDNPDTARDWNADAAAAEGSKEFERRAAARNPPETLNTREWGAAMFEMPDGRIVLGNINHGTHTFQNPGPGGRASVAIDWTAPTGGILIGMIHSHNAGGHVPSGSSPTSDDQDSLRYIRDVRSQIGLSPDQARIYITALTTGPAGSHQYAKINVYNHQNQHAAIQGVEGPEVNPEAQPCS